ncbi:50S ribosomal protein L11 methyltransferase [Sinanaerobacter chloroacetimidivorans]|uniref:Ribosomal protein L11 methyltransferase n=1 Tax=Sinanaerobacter chloroacetimidivorans TaxID=2818044 RepID=A0A8J8AZB1_9FIRM|nr:50S ribosomal protein L11 methyltransferase [Sinanaerobacter chloroacetimidivorans]MBR0596333.1 50S ribosomal protein L11 methyltransferase [Sinanaerobacter chloroacetimidivorans]
MKYIEVTIYTTKEGIDPLTCILMDMGIAGFTISDAADFAEFLNKKNSYDWDYVDESLMHLSEVETSITFYLEEGKEETGTEDMSGPGNLLLLSRLHQELEELKRREGDFGRLHIETRLVDDEDWKDKWKEYFKPARITDRITVKPTWEPYEGSENELIISLDPGMAFGTGTHPTTSLCIKLLEKYLETGKDAVLDVGCGSGILAIAAALLGAKEVKGVEIDPQAVQVARENIRLNGLESSLEVLEGDLTKGLNYQAELVVANLMADLVMMLSEDVAKHLKGKSIYISSGILIEKKDVVADAIQKCGFSILEIMEEGEWCAIAAQKESV